MAGQLDQSRSPSRDGRSCGVLWQAAVELARTTRDLPSRPCGSTMWLEEARGSAILRRKATSRIVACSRRRGVRDRVRRRAETKCAYVEGSRRRALGKLLRAWRDRKMIQNRAADTASGRREGRWRKGMTHPQPCRARLNADPFSGYLLSSRTRWHRRSGFCKTTARGSGWRPNGYRRGVFGGGPQARAVAKTLRDTSGANCCWRPATFAAAARRHAACKFRRDFRSTKKHLRSFHSPHLRPEWQLSGDLGGG